MNYRNRFTAFIKKPQNVILVTLACILTYLTIVPMITIILDTFTVHQSELMRVKGARVGDFTLYHWTKVLFSSASQKVFYEPFFNTIVVAFGTCFVAITLGGSVAWLITRTDIKFKSLISTLFIFPYIMPSWTLAMAWLNFFKNSLVGGAPGLFTAITGIETPNWFAYGPFPIIIVLGLHYAPFAYILIGGILRNMDANLEEAARILKATRGKIMWKITIPIVMPAMLSTFLLVFSSAMSAFAVPAFLGTTVRYQVLTTQMYRTLNGLNPGYGYIMALLMISIGVLILGINQKIVGKRKSFTTITGKSSNISFIKLRRFRNILSYLILILILFVCIFPLISFALESFIMIPGNYTLQNFTTLFWVGSGSPEIANGEPGILRNPAIFKGLWNSVRLSVTVALISGSVGILAGYAIVKKKNTRISTFVNNLAFFPYLMPSMAFGAIYLSMFAVKRGLIPPLYGTFSLLVLVGAVKYLPFASRASIGAMHQLSNEIEEAALIQGISWWKRMVKIIIPIQKSSFLSGYLLPFISCMRELALFILLVTPSSRLLTTMLFQYNEKGWNQYANAINLLIVLFVVISNVVVNRVTGASIDKGIGGQ